VPLPLIAGHEGAGIVQRIGSKVDHISVGDHVLLSFSSCGSCAPCQKGYPAYCTAIFALNFKGSRLDNTKAFTIDGKELSSHFFGQSSFASIAIARASSAIKVDSNLPLQTLCALGCSMQTGSGTVLNVLKPTLGSSVVVFGAGAVGMGAIMAANLTPVKRIIAVDIQESKLEKAREFGATHSINSSSPDFVEQIRNLTDGFGAEYAIDTTGKIPVIRAMIDCAAPGGLVATVGSPPFGETIDIEPASWLARGVSYIGVHQGSSTPQTVCNNRATIRNILLIFSLLQFIPQLIEFWKMGRFPVEKLIKTYTYTDIQEAKNDLQHGICVKAVLLWD
jgi:aryl-alcohol dehydrogenase